MLKSSEPSFHNHNILWIWNSLYIHRRLRIELSICGVYIMYMPIVMYIINFFFSYPFFLPSFSFFFFHSLLLQFPVSMLSFFSFFLNLKMGEKKNLILCTGPIPESKGICVIFQKRAKNVKKDKILFYYIFIFIQDKLTEYI